ncbi:hypothetical protein Q3G72_002185 [Acer saccharum]|nr:hypothetical protein Q3G72_002185 [Acer saccharum]
MAKVFQPSYSGGRSSGYDWKKLWAIKVPPKIKRNWYLRNQVIHGENGSHENDVVAWSRNFLEEFMAAITADTDHNGDVHVEAQWQAPLEGVYKINTDAALDFRNQRIGMGMVIRN